MKYFSIKLILALGTLPLVACKFRVQGHEETSHLLVLDNVIAESDDSPVRCSSPRQDGMRVKGPHYTRIRSVTLRECSVHCSNDINCNSFMLSRITVDHPDHGGHGFNICYLSPEQELEPCTSGNSCDAIEAYEYKHCDE